MDTKHLLKRRQTWYVRVRVPTELVPTVGQKEIVHSLKTRDIQEARDLRWDAVAQIKKHLSGLAEEAAADPNSLQGVIEGAKQLRREVELGLYKDPQETLERTRIGLEVQRDEYLQPGRRAAKGVPIDPVVIKWMGWWNTVHSEGGMYAIEVGYCLEFLQEFIYYSR